MRKPIVNGSLKSRLKNCFAVTSDVVILLVKTFTFVVIGIVILLTFCLPYFTVDCLPGELTASPQTHSTGFNSQVY